MGDSTSTTEFELPLHLQLAMRKAELEAKELTWDQLYVALRSSVEPLSSTSPGNSSSKRHDAS